VRIWDAVTGQPRHILEGHKDAVSAVAISPDGSWLATGGNDGTVRIWDAVTGQPRHILEGHVDWVKAVAISPDGSWLATTSFDGTVRIWDVSTSTEIAALLTVDQGWAAMLPGRGYKLEGAASRRVWYAIGLCRFELGELDAHLPTTRRLPTEAPLFVT
jgi:WD40 repeat protein